MLACQITCRFVSNPDRMFSVSCSVDEEGCRKSYSYTVCQIPKLHDFEIVHKVSNKKSCPQKLLIYYQVKTAFGTKEMFSFKAFYQGALNVCVCVCVCVRV